MQTLQEQIAHIKRELSSKDNSKRQIEVEWANKLKHSENELYNREYQLQQRDSKLKNQENNINNLHYTVKE